MQKLTLTLGELLSLEVELNGYTAPSGDRIISGFLEEKMNLATKYWMTRLSDKLVSEKKLIEVLRNKLVTEYGEEKEGVIEVKTYLDEASTIINPKFLSFQEEFSKLMAEEQEIEYNPLSVSDLGKIDSKNNYNILFKLVFNG